MDEFSLAQEAASKAVQEMNRCKVDELESDYVDPNVVPGGSAEHLCGVETGLYSEAGTGARRQIGMESEPPPVDNSLFFNEEGVQCSEIEIVDATAGVGELSISAVSDDDVVENKAKIQAIENRAKLVEMTERVKDLENLVNKQKLEMFSLVSLNSYYLVKRKCVFWRRKSSIDSPYTNNQLLLALILQIENVSKSMKAAFEDGDTLTAEKERKMK